MPNTAVEAIATTVMMFVGLIIAAFVISSFTSAFASMDSKKQLAGKQLDLVRNYLLVKSVPTDLRSRCAPTHAHARPRACPTRTPMPPARAALPAPPRPRRVCAPPFPSRVRSPK